MRLVQLRLGNFRCFKGETTIDIDTLTAFVGRNDSGKSTVLEALAVFFGEQTIEADDVCVHAEGKDVRLSCVFDDLPKELVLDRQHPTRLADEYLLRDDGKLEIVRLWNGATAKPKAVGTFARARHPTAEGVSDLLALTNKDLKERVKAAGLATVAVDMKVNAQLRDLLRKAAEDLKLADTEVPLDGDAAKEARKVWEQLKPHLPTFALFKSDRSSSDQDAEAQDPMKAAVKEALGSIEDKLEAIAERVRKEVVDVAKATVAKLKEMDPSLARSLNPVFKIGKWESVFSMSLTGDEAIPVNKRGSGVRRLILLNFFRAKAEQRRRVQGAPGTIYAIEEPETSQHPDNQRLLIDVFADLAQQPGCQVLLTTHTPMLAAQLPVGSLRYVARDGKEVVVLGGSEDTYRRIANDLGVLPDHRIKVFVMVEGHNDINFLRRMSAMLHKHDSTIPSLGDLEKGGLIAMLPLGGSTLKKWVVENFLVELNRPEFHLYDCDDKASPKYVEDCKRVNARGNGSVAHLTGKREMESYLHPDAIAEVHAEAKLMFGDWDDVPMLAAEAIHTAHSPNAWASLDKKEQDDKANRAKHWLNSNAVDNMTPERLAVRDPTGEVKGWLLQIAAMAGVDGATGSQSQLALAIG